MKRFPLVFALVGLIFTISSCDSIVSLFGGTSTPTTTESTLAVQIADEWAAAMTSASRSVASSRSAAGLESSQITAIKARALAVVTEKGLNTKDATLDKLLPVFVQGVVSGIKSEIGSDDSIMSATLCVTASAVVKSAGKSDRSSKMGTDQSVTSVIILATSEVTTQITENVSDSAILKTAIAGALSATIEALDDVSAIKAADIEMVVNQTVKAVTTVVLDATNAEDAGGLVQELVTEAATSAGSLDKAGTNQAQIMNTVVTAITVVVVQKASDDSTYAKVSSEILISVTAGVVAASDKTGVVITVTAIITAISDGVDEADTTTKVEVPTETEVTTVAEEVAPTAVASATPATLSAAGTVTLSASGSADGTGGTNLEYQWIRVSGSSVTIEDATSATATVALSVNGTYVFQLTVQNASGYCTDSAEVTVTVAGIDSTTAAAKIDLGLTALKNKNYDKARTYFADAADDTGAPAEASFWAALLDMAAISTDADVVDLMRNRIGLVGYPETMNELFSDTWFNQEWYTPTFTMVKSSTGNYVRGTFTADSSSTKYWTYYNKSCTYQGNTRGTFVVSTTGTDYVTCTTCSNNGVSYSVSDTYAYGYAVSELSTVQLLPELETPTWAEPLLESYCGSVGTNSTTAYPFVLAMNVISKNPDGFDDAIDLVLSGRFGTAFQAVYDTIQAMDNSTLVTIPWSLIAAFYGEDFVEPDYTLKVGAPELKAWAAQFMLQKSFLQLIASYNFDYPLDTISATDWSDLTDANNNYIPDYQESLVESAPNLIEAGFMSDRSQTTRDAAKVSMETGLSDLSTALGLMTETYLERFVDYFTTTTTAYSNGTTTTTTSNTYTAKQLASAVTLAKGYVDGVNTAITSDTTYSLQVSDSMTIAVNPSALYSSAVFSLSALIDSSSTGFVVYGASDAYTTASPTHKPDMTSITTYDVTKHCYYLLKVKPESFNALYPDSYAMLSSMMGYKDSDGNWYVMLASSSSGSDAWAYSSTGSGTFFGSLIDWMAGK